MKRSLSLTAFVLFVISWISGCPAPGLSVDLKVNYTPQSFTPGDTVTFEVEIKNIGSTSMKPRPKVLSFALNESTVIVEAPEAPPYVTSLDPGKSVYKTFKMEMRCKNRVVIESSVPGIEWVEEVNAQPCANFYKDCVDRINKLRALENLPPLMRDQGSEGCSDTDAKINYEKNTPHYSMCGQAQNECPTYSSTSNILDICIEKQMYFDEKNCYSKNPGGCYTDPACMCGHYVNITDKEKHGYTKVACGLYEIPSGKLKSVLNFFK